MYIWRMKVFKNWWLSVSRPRMRLGTETPPPPSELVYGLKVEPGLIVVAAGIQRLPLHVFNYPSSPEVSLWCFRPPTGFLENEALQWLSILELPTQNLCPQDRKSTKKQEIQVFKYSLRWKSTAGRQREAITSLMLWFWLLCGHLHGVPSYYMQFNAVWSN